MPKPDLSKMKLIPQGSFIMGSEKGFPEEKPLHEVTVESFYMDPYPVTNKELKTFCY